VRWVALLLLLANAALAGWMILGQPARPRPSRQPPGPIGELTLVRESPAGDAAAGPCYTLGPFYQAQRARVAGQRLAKLGLDPQQRTTRDREVYGYQVLLPPLPDSGAAVEATRRLADNGIEDYFVIRSNPDLENAVSVGLFEQKRYAVRRSDYLNELGFDAELRLRTRERTRYWQDYRDADERVTPQILKALKAETALQRLERPCR